MRTEKILISEIELNEDRTEGGKGDVESLARNMDKYGQINAVMVVDVQHCRKARLFMKKFRRTQRTQNSAASLNRRM